VALTRRPQDKLFLEFTTSCPAILNGNTTKTAPPDLEIIENYPPKPQITPTYPIKGK